jgi:hypothetical protein
MRTRLYPAGIAMALLTAAAGSARASSIEEIQYTFFAQRGGNVVESAQFVVPEFVTSGVGIPASQLEVCEGAGFACGGVTLEPAEFVGSIGVFDVFVIDDVQGFGPGYDFPDGAFQTLGTAFDRTGLALLDVRKVLVTPPAEAPEPSSLMLLALGSGSLALAKVLQKRG